MVQVLHSSPGGAQQGSVGYCIGSFGLHQGNGGFGDVFMSAAIHPSTSNSIYSEERGVYLHQYPTFLSNTLNPIATSQTQTSMWDSHNLK